MENKKLGCGKELTHEFTNIKGELCNAFDGICGKDGLCQDCKESEQETNEHCAECGNELIRDSQGNLFCPEERRKRIEILEVTLERYKTIQDILMVWNLEEVKNRICNIEKELEELRNEHR